MKQVTQKIPKGLCQKANGVWYIRLTHKGKRIQESTGFTDLNKAINVLNQRLMMLEAAELPEWAQIAQYGKVLVAEKSSITLIDLVNRVYAMEWANESDEWAKRAYSMAEKIIAILGNLSINELNQEHIYQLITELKKRKIAQTTVNRYTAVLSKVLTFATKNGNLTQTFYIPRFKEDNAREYVYSVEERKAIIEWLQDNKKELVLFFKILMETGCRKSEAANLDLRRDFNKEKSLLTFRDTKNGTTRSVPVSSEICLELINRVDQLDQKLTNFNLIQPYKVVFMTEEQVKNVWRKVKKNLHISDEGTIHGFRHTRATELGKAGVSPLIMMQYMGWKSLEMAKRYTHLSADDVTNALDQLGLIRAI